MPTAAFAAHQFLDVPDSNVFHDDIGWLADNEVTRGCNPPDNDMFCPSDTVTREQMAAFMRRLAGTSGEVGDQVTDFDSPLDTSSGIVEALTVDVPAVSDATVALAGHVYLEKTAASEGRYEISIRQDDCTGAEVGMTFWRSAQSDESAFVADTIALTGFDTVSGPQTYALCVDVFVGPDVSVNMRGLTATWSPVG